MPATAKPTITKGTYVHHRIFTHRGLGKVLAVGATLLPSQTPKLHVGWAIGGPLWSYPDDLIAVEAPCATGPRPTLAVVEHQPSAA